METNYTFGVLISHELILRAIRRLPEFRPSQHKTGPYLHSQGAWFEQSKVPQQAPSKLLYWFRDPPSEIRS
jgi:hypothetical protein